MEKGRKCVMVCGKEGFVRFDIDDDFNSILRKEKQYEKNNYDSHNYIKEKVTEKLAEEGLNVSESVLDQLVDHEIKFCDEEVLNEFNDYLNGYKEQLLFQAINPKALEGVQP